MVARCGRLRSIAVGETFGLFEPEVRFVSPEVLPWIALALIVGGMLALDLLVVNRDPKPVPFGKAAAWSAVWISLALGFGLFVAATQGGESAGEYLAGYLIELSLSVDNVFVFALIFGAFAVPAAYQHRLLFWGILGAIVFRAAFIAAGTAILEAAHWVIYLLGILLVVTGIRLARSRGHAVNPEKNPVLRLFRRVVPMTDDYRGAAFVVIEGGRRLATPLLAALVAVETTDIMFALDSIPAVFAITTDPFIVFSSNLFAILGLRSLYFLLAGLLDRFIYLKVGLAALLVFAGAKILTSSIVDIPIAVSLGVIALILGTAIAASLIATHPERKRLTGRATWSVVRVASGVLLGLGTVAAFGLMALLRDADAGWLVMDAAVLLAVAVGVLLGFVLLRRLRAQPAVARAWATLGAATLLLLALWFGLD
jgi:tellurite resistance protein TerC